MKRILTFIFCLTLFAALTGCSDRHPASPGEKSAEENTAAYARMHLLRYVCDEYPDDTVIVSVKPSEAIYLAGGDGGYVPEDQDAWKKAVEDATSRLQDKTYDVFPWIEMLPVCVGWYHDGLVDTWTLNKDGSLWGTHSPDDDIFSKNYIAPEDAAPLAAMIMEVYDFLEIDPIEPAQIGEIRSAELTADGETRFLDDPDALKMLGDTLRSAEFLPGGSACFWELLTLSMEDGSTITLALAGDGCSVWLSDGIAWQYERGTAADLFALFGVDLRQLQPPGLGDP